MATCVVNTKIFNPFMPSLYHLSLVQVSLPLYYEYESEMLSKVLRSLQIENFTLSKADIYGNPEGSYRQAKAKLLSIPEHLRERVVETVHGLENQFESWQYHLNFIKGICDNSFSLCKDILYWRSDGTIDPIKTAKKMVLNKKFHIRSRFQIACVHGLVNDVQEIWAEMEASRIVMKDCSYSRKVEDFWIKWIQNGARIQWTEALLEESYVPVRFISFFHLLQPVDRQKFLSCLTRGCSISGNLKDDILQSLIVMTQREEEEMMRINALDALTSLLNWPYNTLFVEIARKMINFMSFTCASLTLYEVYSRRFRKDNDFREMFEEFWSMCPDDFKARWRESRHYAQKIDNFFEEKILV